MIPFLVTGAGRGELLERSLSGWRQAGFDPVVCDNSGRPLGEAWQRAVEQGDGGEPVWLVCDDTYPRNPETFAGNVERVLAGRVRRGMVVCPMLYNPDGSLQGSGGHGDRYPDGMVARNVAFPLARRDVFQRMLPFPPTSWFVDMWITERAIAADVGPVVTGGIGLVHERISWELDRERVVYDAWRAEQGEHACA